MSRPKLLDLFCCQGGAGRGYDLAGYDVYGIDLLPQPRYPYPLYEGDALAALEALLAGRQVRFGNTLLDLADFAAIHASPPCQAYSVTKSLHSNAHPELVDPTRELLRQSGLPWVMENVVGAPLIEPLVLCGTEFGLQSPTGHWVRRHRLFESNVFLMGAGGCNCAGKLTAYTTGHPPAETTKWKGWQMGRRDSAIAFGIDWMSGDGLAQAIPPAYTRHIGEQLLAFTEQEAA